MPAAPIAKPIAKPAVKPVAKKPGAISVDDQFLQDFVARGGTAKTAQGSPVDASNLDEFLDKVGEDHKAADVTPEQDKLHNKAKTAGKADTTKEDEKAAKKEQERLEHEREQEEKARSNAAQKAVQLGRDKLLDPLVERGSQAVDWLSGLKTVGGVGLLLVILVLLLFVVVTVNDQGDTRAKLLWYMLNGRVTLSGRRTPEKQNNSSSDFETTSAGSTTSQTQATYQILFDSSAYRTSVL